MRSAISSAISSRPTRRSMTFYIGSSRATSTAALRRRIAPRMVGKPLYVLTSGGTASAAEEFIGHVAGYKLGELIGENTAGAGFRNEFFPLPDGMVISISVGQRDPRLDRQGLGRRRLRARHRGPRRQGAGRRRGPCAEAAGLDRFAGQAPAARGCGRDAPRPDHARSRRRFRSGLCRRLRRTDRAVGRRKR